MSFKDVYTLYPETFQQIVQIGEFKAENRMKELARAQRKAQRSVKKSR